MTIAKDLETKIVRALFEQAEAVEWTLLPAGRRTEMYNRWVQDPDIGGRLRRFMPAEEARVWIKDGPMKEYGRAVYGIGKYAPLLARSAPGALEIVRRALGPAWEVNPESLAIKPLRLLACRNEEEIYFTWGPAPALKHLVWAAVTAQADGDLTRWVLCVVGSFEKPTPADDRAAHLRIGQRCGLTIIHVVIP